MVNYYLHIRLLFAQSRNTSTQFVHSIIAFRSIQIARDDGLYGATTPTTLHFTKHSFCDLP